MATLCSQLEIFVNRMKSNSSRGRPIANDSSVQTLFMNVTAMHSQLLHNIQLQDDQRGEAGWAGVGGGGLAGVVNVKYGYLVEQGL